MNKTNKLKIMIGLLGLSLLLILSYCLDALGYMILFVTLVLLGLTIIGYSIYLIISYYKIRKERKEYEMYYQEYLDEKEPPQYYE
jgi:preprotein translocase subunit SecF